VSVRWPSNVVRRVASMTLALSGALAGALATAGAQASTSPAPAVAVPEPGSELEITLITFGLGQEVFERFGHNALWVHDGTHGIDIAYDWGNFSFRQPGFLRRFLTGDTHYWMEGKDANAMVEYYRQLGRPITLQRLNLTPAQRRSLFAFLRWNARDENMYYRYDYFVDNCSTRLRDALDRALGGALRTATDSVRTALTYRRESVRLTDGDRPIQTGIDIALGRPADVPLTPWESFFIPMRLRDALRDVRVPAGPGGSAAPLVAEERVIAPLPGAAVVQELPTAPRLAWRLLLVGVVLAALIAGIRIMAISRRGAAWGLVLVAMAWSLVSGVIGVLLVLAWTATRHVFWAWNENLFQASPLSLLLVVLVPMALLQRRHERATRMDALAVLALSVIGMVLSLVPGGQENRAIVALFLPVHLAIAWAIALPIIAPPRRQRVAAEGAAR
jgi:hypothetical protein